MLETITTMAAIITALSGLVVTVPQLFRVIRLKSAMGVSLPGWTNWCISYTAWVVYLSGTDQLPLFIGCLGEAIVCITTTIVILRNSETYRDPAWYSSALWGLTVTIALVAYKLDFPLFISALLSCSPIWVYGPSAIKAWRSADISGIAPLTWILALTGAVTFAIAGHANPVTVMNGSVAATLSLVILTRLAIGTRFSGFGTKNSSSAPSQEADLENASKIAGTPDAVPA